MSKNNGGCGCCLYGGLGVIGAPLGCGVLIYILFLVVLTTLTTSALPAWAQPSAHDWIMGTPQPVGSEPSDSSSAGIGVGWDGYVDPLDSGPPSGIPLKGDEGVNWWYGCTFHDPNYTNHTGADFPAFLGKSVFSTMSGKVVWAGNNGPWGNLVVIENNGIQIYIAHLNTIAVSKGQIVSRDELVGTVGSTGNSTGTHVHYGIKQKVGDGQVWHNPEKFFDGAEYIKSVCR